MSMRLGRNGALVEVVLVLLVLLVVGALVGRNLTPEPPVMDGAQNVRMAYNLYQYGVISDSYDDAPNPRPTLLREPLVPAVWAGLMALVADRDTTTVSCLMAATPECQGLLVRLKTVQVAFILATAVMTLIAAKCIVGGFALPWAAFLLVAFHGGFWFEANRFYTEIPAAFALLVGSFGLYLAVVRANPWPYALLAGAGFGCLMLVKAVFFYMLPAFLLAAAVYWWRQRSMRAALPVVMVAAVAYGTSGAWVARNYVALGQAKIAGRGEGVLTNRAEYATMPWRDYRLSFVMFLPEHFRQFLDRWIEPDDLARFERIDPDSYYNRSRLGTGAVAEAAGVPDPSGDAKRRAAIEVLKENWVKNVALIATFAWRGAFPPVGGFLTPDDPPILLSLTKIILYVNIFITPLFVPALLVTAGIAFVTGRVPIFVFLLPSLYSYAIHAVATHYIPRYTTPLVPCLVIALVYLAALAWDRWQSRRERWRSADRMRKENPQLGPVTTSKPIVPH